MHVSPQSRQYNTYVMQTYDEFCRLIDTKIQYLYDTFGKNMHVKLLQHFEASFSDILDSSGWFIVFRGKWTWLVKWMYLLPYLIRLWPKVQHFLMTCKKIFTFSHEKNMGICWDWLKPSIWRCAFYNVKYMLLLLLWSKP